MKSDIKNAVVIGANVTYEKYSEQPIDWDWVKLAEDKSGLKVANPETFRVKRGDPRYIMSRSELVEFAACPMKWLNAPVEEPTDALKYGSLLDTLALQPHQFDDLYYITPATYVNDDGEEKPWNMNAKFCKNYCAKREDKIAVKQRDFDAAQDALRQLHLGKEIREFIECSEKQVMVTADYVDPETGIVVPIRVLTDLLPIHTHPRYGKSIADFKTTADASQWAWKKSVANYNYDMQAAMALDLHTAANPKVERIEFRHLIMESSPPYQTGRRILSTEFVDIGRAKYMAALRYYAKCLKHKLFPDFEIGNDVINGWSITNPDAWMLSQSFEYAVNWPVEKKVASENETIDTPP